MPLFSKVAEIGEQISFVIYKKDTKAVGEKRSRVSPLHSRASSFCEIQGGGGEIGATSACKKVSLTSSLNVHLQSTLPFLHM